MFYDRYSSSMDYSNRMTGLMGYAPQTMCRRSAGRAFKDTGSHGKRRKEKHNPERVNKLKEIEFDYTYLTNEKWKETIAAYLKGAKNFEIHCWDEETEEIAAVLSYGELKKTDWQYGKIIVGPVTPEFIDFLLELGKPKDTDIYNKMTPFFSIFLDNGFSSEHYGTELHITELDETGLDH